jgi:hypothetical protein
MAVDKKRRMIRAFLAEAAIYAVIVAAYFLLVLRFLGGWLKESFDHDRPLYAAAALLLMLGQGVVLEVVTSAIFRLFKGRGR